MSPEKLVEKIRAQPPSGLRSVVLYGSAAAGDHTGRRSDYNILVVCERMGLSELKALAGPTRGWMKAGNPPPLLFTPERLHNSADVFPIELLDMKESHKILYGEDVLAGIEVSGENLRLQLEHELKGKLIGLRQGFLAARKPGEVLDLLVVSLSPILVLLRAALRLHQDSVPAVKMEAARELARHLDFETGVFEEIEGLKRGRKKQSAVDPEALFERYLDTVQTVADAIDAYARDEDV